MKLLTVRAGVALCIVFSTSRLSLGQAITLTMKPTEIHHGDVVSVELLLDARSKSAQAGLQWEFKLSPGMQIAQIEEGRAVKKAGKTLACNGAKCLVYGWNRTTIPNGQIAVAKIRVVQSADGAKASGQFGYQSHGRDINPQVQITDVVAASLEAKVIKVVANGGATFTSNKP